MYIDLVQLKTRPLKNWDTFCKLWVTNTFKTARQWRSNRCFHVLCISVLSPMSKLKNSNEGSRHSLDGGRFSIAGCRRRGEGRGWQPGRGGAGLGATALWTRLGKNVGFVANSFKRHAFSGFQVYIDSAVMNHQALIEFVKSKAVVFKVDLFPNVSTKDKKVPRSLHSATYPIHYILWKSNHIFYFQLQSLKDFTEVRGEELTTRGGRTSRRNN